MRHLRIKVAGHVNIDRPLWPLQQHDSFTELPSQYQAEPILTVEIDKRTWDAMFDLYEAHIRGFANPTVQDAWHQYQVALKLCGLEGFGGDKQI